MFPNWFNSVKPYFERNCPTTPLRALQIGTYTGDATEWLLTNRDIEYIHDVDTWEGSDEQVHKNLDFNSVEDYYNSRFKGNKKVLKHKMKSDTFFWNNVNSYNFIYIDGDHTALQTAIDGLNAFRLLEVGGVLAFDDYEWHTQGEAYLEPKLGVDSFLSICSSKIKILEIGYQVWVQKC